MICWMFPGQPVAYTDVPAGVIKFHEIAQLCQETTGYNPIGHDNTAAALTENIQLQLYGTSMSLFHFNVLTNRGLIPEMLASHSMGIYAALAASGSIDNATALELTCRIGRCIAGMRNRHEYALGCVIGLTCGPLKSVASGNGVHIANHNTSRHFLLAGERGKIDASLIDARNAGAFSVSAFPCDAPLHTQLIWEIAGDLHRIVADYHFLEPQIPLVEHIGQTTLTAATIPAFLVDELCHPVYWEKTYRALRSRGATRFQEVGANLVLSKFNRWIDSES